MTSTGKTAPLFVYHGADDLGVGLDGDQGDGLTFLLSERSPCKRDADGREVCGNKLTLDQVTCDQIAISLLTS